MKASIIGVSGPHERTSVLIQDELSIGRDTANSLSITDSSVSRRHCLIVQDGSRYLIRDLDSHNGTFVNGATIREHVLESGDLIRIGPSVFQFSLGDTEAPRRTATVSFEELPSPDSASELTGAGSPKERMARDFGVLLTIATRLRGIRNSESLLWQLVGVLFEVVPTERVAILLGEDNSSLQPAFAWDRETGPGIPVRVSRKVVDRVISEKEPLLVNNCPRNLTSTSLKDLGVYSVLCVPLCTPDKPLGVVYMDNRNIGALFDEGHLQMMTAISTIAAIALENTRFLERLEVENQQLKAEVRSQFDMIGEGPAMQDLYRFIAKVAPTESNILIHGESGTGKELVARAIHRNSARAEATFVPINCAALTETLLESELFGYEKGAFTGAVSQKRGYLEVADGGTIFLDEIGELALPLQAKLLRALQEREIVRVGGTRPIKINIRVIAATNRQLGALVKDGRFREDLYYRLNVVSCTLAPLRKRREDISQLAQHFVEKYAVKCNRRVQGLSDQAIACLLRYDWPGNVRELENAMERAVVLGTTALIVPDDLPESVMESDPALVETSAGYHAEVARKKKELILNALDESHGNFTEAAKLLGIHPNYLHRLVRILELRPERSRSAKK